MMKMNVGTVDSFIRMSIGTCLLFAAAVYYSWWSGAAGVLLLLSSLYNWCPVYRILGFSSRNKHTTLGSAK